MTNRPLSLAALLAAAALGLTACGSGSTSATPKTGDASHAHDWEQVLEGARGDTVNWYMWGGDPTLNEFVNGYVADQLKQYDIGINQVKINDTAEALDTMLGEKQAGKTDGSVDLVWVNGENFATGKQADLWSCDWAQHLPNGKYVDLDDPAVSMDFGVPVDGCEAVWQQANSALVYNSDALDAADVESVESLLAWAKENPGRFTYPAPPDFTGSMAVRTLLYDTIGGPEDLAGPFDEAAYDQAAPKLWERLNTIEPTLWRQGQTYPQSQDQVEKMFADGEIDAYFTYGPGAVADKVKTGVFPQATREAVLSGGNIANSSFVGIPANAAHSDAAMVLANVLQDPATQLELYKLEGVYPGIDLTKTSAEVRQEFASVPLSASVLPLEELLSNAQPELASDYVTRIERDWKSEVLQ